MSKSVVAIYKDDLLANQAVLDLQKHGVKTSNILLAEWPLSDLASMIATLEKRNVPHERAEMYAEAVRRGASLVMADTEDDNAAEAAEVLDAHAPIDIQRSADRWRTAGWQGFQYTSSPYPEPELEQERQSFNAETFEVIEEQVRVGKRVLGQTMKVRSLVTERPVSETLSLREEHIGIKRERADKPIPREVAEQAFQSDDQELVVTAMKEEPVVEKQARVVEEVTVTKEGETRTETIAETERRRDIVVEPAESKIKPKP